MAAEAAHDIDERLVSALCAAVEHEPGQTAAAVRAQLTRLAPLAGPELKDRLVRAAVARLDGLGALDTLFTDAGVDEILVNAAGDIWTDRHGRLQRHGTISPDELAVVVERILAPLGRRVDRTSPVVDARLADGSRVCAVVPPVSPGGTCLSLRRFRATPLPLAAFADERQIALLTEVIERRCNLVVSGATSSGKTSLLSSLLGLVAPGERIVTLEDTAELAPAVDHLVRLEARPATSDGIGAITVDHLLHTALRLRPDRIVVGEVRGPEIVSLVQALNTGHDGSLSTVHANSAADALGRLESLVVQAAPGWPLAAVRDHLVRCLDVVTHVERASGGRRRIATIAEVGRGADGAPVVTPLCTPGQLSRSRKAPA